MSKEGNNEFHFLAPNINCIEAVEIGKLLLSKGTSVMQKDVKYGNTAFFRYAWKLLRNVQRVQ